MDHIYSLYTTGLANYTWTYRYISPEDLYGVVQISITVTVYTELCYDMENSILVAMATT